MAFNMYQVRRIEYKGLGCFASKYILKGSLISTEIPQIPHFGDENVLAVWEAYQKMSEADKLEYMTLHDKSDNIENLPLDMQPGLFFIKDLAPPLITLKSFNNFH